MPIDQITTLITDLDGTLVDTRTANIIAYEQAFKDAALPFSRSEYEAAFGLRFDEMVSRLAPNATADQRALIQKQKRLHYSRSLNLITVNNGLVALLKDGKMNGKKIGIATTAQSQNARAVLDFFSITSIFDELVFGEDVQKGKPDPECYNILLSRLGAKPHECVIFEDSEVGMEAAGSTGAHTVRVAL